MEKLRFSAISPSCCAICCLWVLENSASIAPSLPELLTVTHLFQVGSAVIVALIRPRITVRLPSEKMTTMRNFRSICEFPSNRQNLLPDFLTGVHRLEFLLAAEQRVMNQIQALSFVRFIQLSSELAGNDVNLLRAEELASVNLPAGYRFVAKGPGPDEVGCWSLDALRFLFSVQRLSTTRRCIEAAVKIAPPFDRLFFATTELQPALERWKTVNEALTSAEQSAGVKELIQQITGIDRAFAPRPGQPRRILRQVA